MNRKLANIIEFYKSTLTINLAFSVCSIFFGGFAITFATIGFIASLSVKEVNNKNEYLFYNNNGITKVELWIYSFAINLFLISIFKTLYLLFWKI